MPSSDLVFLNQAERLLATLTRVDEIKEVRDRAEALRIYAKRAQKGIELQNQAAVVKLRAERRAGVVLLEMKDSGERYNGRGGDRKSEYRDDTPILEDLGISRLQSSRWQQVARIPVETFERQIAEVTNAGTELTTQHFVALWGEIQSANRRAQAQAVYADLTRRAALIPHDERARVLEGSVLEVLASLAKESIHLVVTSPPYPGVPDKWGDLFAPENFDAAHAWLDQVWDECVRVLVPGGHLAINIGDVGRHPVLPNGGRVMMYRNPNAELIGNIIWDQNSQSGNTAWGTYANPTQPHLCDDHEYIVIFQKRGKRPSPLRSGPVIDQNDFMEWRRSIWRIQTASAAREHHPAPFPPELPRRLIQLYTFPGETVLDPFAGSGTTLVQALQLQRLSLGIEIEKEYAALACANVAAALESESGDGRSTA